jgi:hypothetical protein
MFEKGRFQSQTSILIEVSKNDKLTQWLACLLVLKNNYIFTPEKGK